MQARKVVFIGETSLEASIFDPKNMEITMRSDCLMDGHLLKQVPFLRLYACLEDGLLQVEDGYSPALTWLKPCREFREFLLNTICHIKDEQDQLIASILTEYSSEIKRFSEELYILSEARAAVNRLRTNQPEAPALARKILNAIGLSSHMDTMFESRQTH
jgi:hypothetical protein